MNCTDKSIDATITEITPDEFGEFFETYLRSCRILPLLDSPYHKVGDEIFEMAQSYRSDGLVFAKINDPVNSHAAYSYGFGWLDFGYISGLISYEQIVKYDLYSIENRLPRFVETMSQKSKSDNGADNLGNSEVFDKLFEKTNRYHRMFTNALSSITQSQDVESPLYPFTKFLYASAESRLLDGSELLVNEKYVNALAHFSYGYGFIDAAVRAGLFTITNNRELFTV